MKKGTLFKSEIAEDDTLSAAHIRYIIVEVPPPLAVAITFSLRKFDLQTHGQGVYALSFDREAWR